MAIRQQLMGIDQNGTTYHGLEHPRKDLMERLGYKSAQKMFCDLKDGGTREKGYVIGPYWVSLYKVSPWKRSAGGSHD